LAMLSHVPRRSLALVALAVAALIMVVPVVQVMGQSTGCPIADDGTASQAVGSPASGKVDVTVGNMMVCTFVDGSAPSRAFGVSRETAAFGPAEGGAAALAQRYIPGLPDAARAEIAALSQAGMNVALPDYQFEAVGGVGDSALWVKTQLVPGFFKDSLLVQRGGDAFAFDVDDSPDARAALTALAQAVLAQP
jgi:hypothetical protein